MDVQELKEEIRTSYDNLDKALEEGKLLELKSLINELAIQDIAIYLQEAKDDEVKATLFRLLRKDTAIEVFEHLEYEEQEILLNSLKQERVIEILEKMDPDDRTMLFEEMPATVVKKYIAHLSPEERQISIRLLGYPEDSVGRRMTTDYVSFRKETTVRQAIDRLKELALDKETIYHCYIIDNTRKLIGYCSLKMLLLADWDEKLENIMKQEVIDLNAHDDQEEAGRYFRHYDLLALPVTDNEKRLVGIITFDDATDVIEEEASEDIQRMAAIVPEEHPYFDSGIFNMAGKRIIWLSILLVAQLFSGMILKGFEHSLQAAVGLAFFIPMLMSSGGNTGGQSSAMIIRGLAVGEIRVKHWLSVIGKELRTGLLLGVGLSVLAFGSSYILEQQVNLALVVGISICLTVIASAIIGGTLPLVFRALNLDPALMSGPFITTLVDIFGLFIYFQTFQIIYG